jgi:hypothetical protein
MTPNRRPPPACNVVLELVGCPHDRTQTFRLNRGRELVRCTSCGALQVDGAWHACDLVESLAASVRLELEMAEHDRRAFAGDAVGDLFDMCRCGHDRGEHMGLSPCACEADAHIGNPTDSEIKLYPCACKGFEMVPKNVPTSPGLRDAPWEDRTPAPVIDLAKYRVRQ